MVIHIIFSSLLLYRMYHKQALIPVYFKHYLRISTQAFLIISPPLPKAFQILKYFVFNTPHKSEDGFYN